MRRTLGATITSRSAVRIRINFWRMVGLYISFGDWANALECWRSPSLRLVIPGIAVSPGVTHSDSRIVFVTGTVVKPQQPTNLGSFHPHLALTSVVAAIGRAGLREEMGMLGPGPRGPKVLRHQMVQWFAGGMEYPTPVIKTTAVLLGFLNLTNVMFSFVMTRVLASYSDKFKIIITLRWAQTFLVRNPIKISIFSFTHICMSFFSISPEN